MKIAIDIQTVIRKPTGVGQYVKNLVVSLAALDNEDEFHLFYFDFKRRFTGLGIENPSFHLEPIRAMPGRIYNFLSENFGLPDIGSLTGAHDVYHFPNFIIHPLKKGKAVVTVCDLSFIRFPRYAEPGNLTRLDKRFDYTICRADAVIAISEFTKKELTEIYSVDPARIRVIHPGVNIRKVTDTALRLPEKYFLFMGTIEPRKNLSGLLDAWKIIKEREKSNWPYKLLVIGSPGWQCPPAGEQVKEKGLEGDVEVLGYVGNEDIPRIYSRAEALVFPSLYEGFGLPPLEAMGYGTPVIASKAQAVPEITGDAGLFIDPHKPDEIAAAIINLAGDQELRHKLIERGKSRVKLFTNRKMAVKTLGLYRELL
jgi:glycosyltransferase involved in cell wall biosynthesis